MASAASAPDHVVVAADRDHAAARQAGGGRGLRAHRAQAPAARHQGRHQRRLDLQRLQHLGRPGECADVEREGPGREAVVGRHLAAQAPGEVVGDVQPPDRAREGVDAVAPMPEQLAQAEDRVRRQARDSEQAVRADPALDLGHLRPRTLVEPGDRRPGRPAGGIERHRRLGHARERDADDASRVGHLVERRPDRTGAAPPQALAIVLGPFRARVGDRRRLAGDRDHAAGGIDDNRLGVGRASVDPDQQWPRPARLPCYHALPSRCRRCSESAAPTAGMAAALGIGNGKGNSEHGFRDGFTAGIGPWDQEGGLYLDTTLLATARRAALVAEETRDSVAKTVLDELKATQPGRRRESGQE